MARITTSFGFSSTAAEVSKGIDLTGRRAIVTGGGSGIGIETARALAVLGAEITLAVRNEVAAKPVVAELIASTGNSNIRSVRLDLADRATIAALIDDWQGPLHLLVNNAGVMALPTLERTAHGVEMQFATNHLGHFALALGLQPALAAAGNARIVALSSSGHLFSPVIFDDPHFNFVPYDPFVAYGQSKSATSLFAVEATRRWARHGITANAVMPGAIATNLQRHTGGLRTPVERRKTPEQGAATTLLVATSPRLNGIGGRYFEDCNEAIVVDHRTADYTGVAPYALDPANAERLWELSLTLLGHAQGSGE
ncbi:SDR family NAD(P)-dependent oxidoreductase [Sphingomonas sp. AR_OL41]|uniref:SDR family NAD(P)-dependent oxidoreductase n=1 Tax=Sphingomonas sp. AR_OL41 TaxID=3042729 RepID=UPI002480793B|nr:SDR family NAD(P)-dependent oxidoreductase [Sphingomonas sp. AR_OL41]MDH7972865.1 SDR family NAD(P)-dependent oxidoreductase [Sphingomonas sp. AR_OL41]